MSPIRDYLIPRSVKNWSPEPCGSEGCRVLHKFLSWMQLFVSCFFSFGYSLLVLRRRSPSDDGESRKRNLCNGSIGNPGTCSIRVHIWLHFSCFSCWHIFVNAALSSFFHFFFLLLSFSRHPVTRCGTADAGPKNARAQSNRVSKKSERNQQEVKAAVFCFAFFKETSQISRSVSIQTDSGDFVCSKSENNLTYWNIFSLLMVPIPRLVWRHCLRLPQRARTKNGPAVIDGFSYCKLQCSVYQLVLGNDAANNEGATDVEAATIRTSQRETIITAEFVKKKKKLMT